MLAQKCWVGEFGQAVFEKDFAHWCILDARWCAVVQVGFGGGDFL
jgi:hypothetical protein